MAGPGGSIINAEIQVGDSVIMLGDENPAMGARSPQSINGTPVSVFLYVSDVDAAFKKAVDAGATATMPPTDMFWGDRFSKLTDPFGHEWAIATHIEDVSPDEMEKRSRQYLKEMSGAK